jgi:hypothetical protein
MFVLTCNLTQHQQIVVETLYTYRQKWHTFWMKSTRVLHFSARNIHQYLLIPGDRHDLCIIFSFSLSVRNKNNQRIQLHSSGKWTLASASKNCIITWSCCIWSYKGHIKMGQNGVESNCCSYWGGGEVIYSIFLS